MHYLEHLCALLHCEYLSDLRTKVLRPSEAEALLYDAAVFPPKDYQDAAWYLTGSPQISDDPMVVRRVLASVLLHPRDDKSPPF